MAKNDLEYSLRMIEKAKDISKEVLDYTPLVIPLSDKVPETTQTAISRILLQSGQISLDQYHKMHGVVYEYDDDGDDDDFYDDFEDEFEIFKQTRASYDEVLDVSPSDSDSKLETNTNVVSSESSTGGSSTAPAGAVVEEKPDA